MKLLVIVIAIVFLSVATFLIVKKRPQQKDNEAEPNLDHLKTVELPEPIVVEQPVVEPVKEKLTQKRKYTKRQPEPVYQPPTQKATKKKVAKKKA